MEAKFYTKLPDDNVQCRLCPHECIITHGNSGRCKVRLNRSGTLHADTYGALSASRFDPIEKKPLYHFFPDTEILSLGSVGCNFNCQCCQNYEISQSPVTGFPRFQDIPAVKLIEEAKSHTNSIGIAFTYNEPIVWYEYMLDLAQEVQNSGLKNIMVTNGYINKKPLQQILPFIDAFNIDLKAFDPKVHMNYTGGELPFVKHTLKSIVTAQKHLEITFLLVPGLNDDFKHFTSMIQWIAQDLGKEVPLHISRYFPRYRTTTEATNIDQMIHFANTAKEHLDYVYLGNVSSDLFQETRCNACGSLLIQRNGYQVNTVGVSVTGECLSCGFQALKR